MKIQPVKAVCQQGIYVVVEISVEVINIIVDNITFQVFVIKVIFYVKHPGMAPGPFIVLSLVMV